MDNIQLIIIAFVSSILLILGPIAAVIIRLSGIGNIDTIFVGGIVFEIIGMVGFWLIIRKFYLQEEVEENGPTKKKSKEKRPEPDL